MLLRGTNLEEALTLIFLTQKIQTFQKTNVLKILVLKNFTVKKIRKNVLKTFSVKNIKKLC